MDHSPTFAFLKDSSGRYVYANRPFETLLETSIEGKTAFDWMAPKLPRNIGSTISRCYRAGKQPNLLSRYQCRTVAAGTG